MPPAFRRMRLLTAMATLVAGVLECGWSDVPPPAETRREQMVQSIMRHVRETGGKGATLDALAFFTERL